MNEATSEYFAVIDVETNWNNEVMSVGVAVANSLDFCVADKKYYILYPECKSGGMFSDVLRDVNAELITDCSRETAVKDIIDLLTKYFVTDIFAYNAPFDYKCMRELHKYVWRDILPVAANCNKNGKLPNNCEYFSTGLLKHGRSLQNIMRLIYWRGYTEQHNALQDALDELQLMQLINQPIEAYAEYKPRQTTATATPARRTAIPHREESLLGAYKYVIDELCGGSVRLLDFYRTTNISSNGGGKSTPFTDYFNLLCSRCGHKWTQDAETFFKAHTCPKCGKQ